MSRTYKDYGPNQRWDHRVTSHKSGVKKGFKRASHKKARKTPILSQIHGMEEVTINLSFLNINIEVTMLRPTIFEVEQIPQGLDIWSLD